MSEALTQRERQVLKLIMSGMSNKEIAHELCLSLKTLAIHRGSIYKKFDVHDAVSLVLITCATVRFPRLSGSVPSSRFFICSRGQVLQPRARPR
jgi:DNA-binding CsgD family transcriptional regulator